MLLSVPKSRDKDVVIVTNCAPEDENLQHMLAVPSIQKKMKGQMNQYIIGPYQKVVEQAKKQAGPR